MDAGTVACAPSGLGWQTINWKNVRRQVRKLQVRIVKATQDGRYGKVKALQWLLTHSFSGKALAVKRVTEKDGIQLISEVKPGAARCLCRGLSRVR